MSPPELAAFLGPALLYAVGLAGIIFGLAKWAGLQVDERHALTLFLAAFFLSLTQHPLPDRNMLDCSNGGMPPTFQPFAMIEPFARFAEQHGTNIVAWAGYRLFQAVVMNFVLPALIGMALARHMGGSWGTAKALAIGFSISSTAEIAQLTGLFGLYPCPWRRFMVDDLILNTAGLATGFTIARFLLLRSTREL